MPSLDMSKASIRCRCGKVYAASRHDATKVHAGVLRRRRRRGEDTPDTPVRYYQCGYGGWHWTSQVVNTHVGGNGARYCATEWCNETVPEHMTKYHSVECREAFYASKTKPQGKK